MTIMFQKFETYMTITPLLLFELGKGVKNMLCDQKAIARLVI